MCYFVCCGLPHAIREKSLCGKNINIVTQGGTKIGEYASNKNQNQHQWVRKNTTPQQHFDVCEKNETFKQDKQEILQANIDSTSNS
jgi:hypothetical protein